MTRRERPRQVGYYPGCMGLDCARELDESVRAVLEALDTEPVELADWTCCGGLVVDEAVARGLTRRVLDRAQEKTILCACPVCARRMRAVNPGRAVRSVVGLLTEPYYLQLLEERAEEDLEGLKAACYYGPGAGQSESAGLEQLVRACGAEVVKWPGRRKPHGGLTAFTDPALMQKLCSGILVDAIEAGADFMVLSDPHAQFNLDCFQYPIGRELGRAVQMPVLFCSELVAHALGLEAAEACYRRHVTSPLGLFLDYYDRREVAHAPKPLSPGHAMTGEK